MHDLRHSFPGQESDEVVYIFARPFFLAFVPTAILFLIVYFFAFGTQYVVANNVLIEFSPYISNVLVLLLGVFQLIALVVFLVAIIDFYFDILIVTNQRLVDIDQQQLFSRPISELSLSDVQDVKSDVTGFWHTLFNYGTVHIQTAGATPNFVAESLRYPREITSIITDLSQQAKDGVDEGLRHPRTHVIGMIDNHALRTVADLGRVGALLPEDVSRLSRIDGH